MDFMIPPEQNEDPADDWKKDSSKPPIPDVYKKYAFGYGIPFSLADQIAMRFTELGFDPETIHDPTIFGMLFITRENCLIVTRQRRSNGKYYVSGHRFLERKKK
jgi:hypothetical protein